MPASALGFNLFDETAVEPLESVRQADAVKGGAIIQETREDRARIERRSSVSENRSTTSSRATG